MHIWDEGEGVKVRVKEPETCGAPIFGPPRAPPRANRRPASPVPVHNLSEPLPAPPDPVQLNTRPARTRIYTFSTPPRPPVKFSDGPRPVPVHPKNFDLII
jgi:hypothetical protein